MSTYCRITGRSRGLPKPHYFPLLPPISPADARRICRITGKSYGLPTHHFIPVLTVISRTRVKTQCHITSKSEGQESHHYEPPFIKHVVQKGFRYLTPLLETNAELTSILEGKPLNESNHKFIYTVDEKKCTLVLPGQLEAAVRDGDVKDIMFSKDSDKILIKLRKGATVELDVKDYSAEGAELFEGEGPNRDTLVKRKKRKTNNSNNWRRKIFEDKEKQALSEEERLSEIKSKRIKVKLDTLKDHPVCDSWKNVRVAPSEVQTDHNFDDKFKGILQRQENEQNINEIIVNVTGRPYTNGLPQPTKVESQIVDLSHSLPGIIQQPIMAGDTVAGFPVAKIVAPFQPFIAEIEPAVAKALKEFNGNKSVLQNILQRQNLGQQKHNNLLPSLESIPGLVKSICKLLEKGKCNNKNNKFDQGLKIVIDNHEKYVPGQFMKTDAGELFVPGNVVETSAGPSFVPGFVLHANEGNKFLPGFILKDNDNLPIFVAGQTALTRAGEKFVQGQVLNTKEGARFMPGQTVITGEGVKFVPGQVIHDQKCENGHRFVPGQIVMTPEGPQFITGQFCQDSKSGEVTFIPGQSILNENCNWEFIPGQNMKIEDGSYVFVAGKEIVDNEGHRQFVPGQVVIEGDNIEHFVPGITVNDDNGNMHFIPGMEVTTDNGTKFVEGVITAADDTFSFTAGKVIKTEKDTIEFSNAKTVHDLVFHNVHSGIPINSAAVSSADATEVFGHLVQSAQGVEFFPGEAIGLPAGKVIPGRLVKGKEMRFIPGTIIDGKFTPGQFVTTKSEEKFIPGQVIETNDGPKFVPGKVLQTRTGPKFVPGQTMETENGPKFIPGQIIETKRGPTFIPGQVIHTEEEGSRFVPGQVVDTVEGPRFVPGRVVETGDHVTFIPGQIVETEEGLKFIAPDLEDDPEGGYQFTVQGFEVAPEELQMIGNAIPHACFIGEMAIDAKTLQQLAEAGMAVGRQLPVDIPSVNIRSLPVTETACRIADNLNIDASQSVKMSHILSSLQQIKQAGVSFTADEIGDENLKALMYLALKSEHDKESFEFLQTLGEALEDTIKVDSDKVETINNLHESTVDLIAKVRERSKLVDKAANQVAVKLNLDSAYVQKRVGQILSNLQQIKKSNVFIPRKEIKDKNLKMLINLVSNCDTELAEPDLLKALGTALENTIQVDPAHSFETIETLCQLTSDFTTKAKTSELPSIGAAHSITCNLNVDPANSVKVNHILVNLQKIKKSNIVFSKDEIDDENLQVLLNLVQTCDDLDEDELRQAVASAFEKTVKLNLGNKLDTINKLHELSGNFAQKANKKSILVTSMVKDLTKKFNANEENVEKLKKIVTGFMKIKQYQKCTLPSKMESEIMTVLINFSQENKNLTDIDFLEALKTKLEDIITIDPQNIDILLSSTANIVSDVDKNIKLTSETALTMADELEMNPEYLSKMSDIISNLQRIKKAKVPINPKDINNGNLEVLLNLASMCDLDIDNDIVVKNLATALQNTVKVDLEQKLQTVDVFQALTADLAIKSEEKAIFLDQTACNIAEKVKVDMSQSIKLAQILSNLEQVKLSNISLANECIEDTNLKILLEAAVDEEVNRESFSKVIGEILENLVTGDLESKLKIINNLEASTQNLATRAKSRLKKATESACGIAHELDVSTPQLVKIEHILSNLQQIAESNAPIQNDMIKDSNMELLLNLALSPSIDKNDPEALRALCNVLEKTIKVDLGKKVETIDVLEKMTSNLASESLKQSSLIKQTASVIISKLDLDEAQAIKLGQILSNLQQIDISKICNDSDDFKDKDFQTLLNAAKKCKNATKKDFLKVVGHTLEKVIKENPELKIENIDKLQTISSNLVSSERARSKLIAETALEVGNKLNVSTPQLVQVSHILSNLQQIQETGFVIPDKEMKNENLELLLSLSLAYDPDKNDDKVIKMLVGVLQNTIEVDPEQKLNTIETLHHLTTNLNKATQSKSKLVKQAVGQIADKYDLEPQSSKLNQIIVNVLNLSKADIPREDMTSQHLRMLLNVVLEINKSDEPELLQLTITNLERIIKDDVENKSTNIDSLHDCTTALASKMRNRSLLTAEIALAMANDLNVSSSQLVKMSHILSNLQQIKQANFVVSGHDIINEDFEILMNLALACDNIIEDPVIIQTLANALQKTINLDPENKVDNINKLDELTSSLVTRTKKKINSFEKTASNISSKFDIDEPYTLKLVHILSNLQQIKMSEIGILKQGFKDENLELLLQRVLKCDIAKGDSKFLQIVGNAIEGILKKDLDHKEQTIDLLHSLTCDLVTTKRAQLLQNAEAAYYMSKELDLSKLQLVKVNHILSNIQQIQKSNLTIAPKELCDENLELLFNLALVCTDKEKVTAVQSLANVILKTIAVNPEQKDHTIDNLNKLTFELAEEACKKILIKEHIAADVAKKLDSQPIQVEQILSNLQQIKLSNIDINREGIENKDIRQILKSALDCDIGKGDIEFLKAVGCVLKHIATENVNELLQTTDILVTKAQDRTFLAAEAAYNVATDLKMKTPQLVKISHILKNLCKFKEANIGVPCTAVMDNHLEMILSLSLAEDNSNNKVIESFASALQKTLRLDSDSCVQTVDSLHEFTDKIATLADQKSGVLQKLGHELADKLNISNTHFGKIVDIISNLQQLGLANVDKRLIEEIEDKESKKLIKTALHCKNLIGDIQHLEAIALVLEDMVRLDPDMKLQKLDLLQKLTDRLTAQVYSKSKLTIETAIDVANNLKLSTPYLVQVSHILDNLQQIKQSNFIIPEAADLQNENVELLMNLAFACSNENNDKKALQMFAKALQKTLDLNPKESQCTIQVLNNFTACIASKACTQLELFDEIANQITKDLKIDESHSNKVSQLLSNLQRIKLSNIDVNDDSLKMLLATNCFPENGVSDFIEQAKEVLTNIIKINPENKIQTINTLQRTCNDLVSQINDSALLTTESAYTIANEMNASTTDLVKMSHILANLEHLKRVDFLPESISVDENLELLMKLALASNNKKTKPAIVKSLAEALKKTASLENIENVIETLDKLTKDLDSKGKEKLQVVKRVATEIGKKCSLDNDHIEKLSRILNDIQRIKGSNINLSKEDIKDEKVKLFLNNIIECNINATDTESLEATAGAIQNIIISNLENKNDNIDLLHNAIDNIATKVRDKALLTTETAYGIVTELNMSTPQLVKLGHILSNLHDIKKMHAAVPMTGVKGDNLELVLKLSLSCDANIPDDQIIRTLAHILQNTINIDPKQKSQTVDNLHMLTDELVKDVRERSKIANIKATEIVQNLNVGEAYSLKLAEILSNLQQIKFSGVDITKHNIKNENWKMLINFVIGIDHNLENVEFFNLLSSEIEKVIRTDPEHKLQNINSLHAALNGIITKENNKSFLIASTAYNIATELKVTTPQMMEISCILSNLQEIKQANVSISKEEIQDEKLKVILNLASAYDLAKNDVEAMEALSKALKDTIQVDCENKELPINVLHNLTTELNSRTHKKTEQVKEAAQEVAIRLEIDDNMALKLVPILSELQQLCISDIKLEKEDIKNENIKSLLKYVTQLDKQQSSQACLESIADALEIFLKDDVEHQPYKIDELHACVTNLNAKRKHRELLLTENAMEVASQLKLNTSDVIKVIDILSNVQQMKESGVAIPIDNNQNDTLKLLLNLTQQGQNENSDADNAKKLKNILENTGTMKMDLENKKETVNALHTLTSDLMAKVEGKVHLFNKFGCKIANQLNVNQPSAIKLSEILSNLQCITLSDINIIQNIENQDLKALLELARKYANKEDEEFIKVVGNALEKILKVDMHHTCENIDTLQCLTSELAIKVSHRTLQATETAQAVASNLKLDIPETIKISEVLLNLEHLYQMNIPLAVCDIKNEDVKLLINLALAHRTDSDGSEIVPTLGEALEKIIGLQPESKLQIVDLLKNITTDFVTKADKTLVLIENITVKLAENFKTDYSSREKINSILTNILSIKHSNVELPLEYFKDKNIKVLLNATSGLENNIEDAELLQTIGDILENILNINIDFKTETIDALHSSMLDIASYATDKSFSHAEIACQVAKHLKLNEATAVNISYIISDLKHLKKMEALVSNIDIEDQNLKLLFNHLLAYEGNTESPELLRSIANALENSIKVDKNEFENVNKLQSVTAHLVSVAQIRSMLVEKVSCKLANKFKVSSNKLSKILSNLQQIRRCSLYTSFDDLPDKDIQTLVNFALENDCDDVKFFEGLGDLLEKIIKANSQCKSQIVNTICAVTTDLASGTRDKSILIAETANNIASSMNMDASTINISHILSNLQQIKQMNIALKDDEIEDENLKLLLNLTLAYDRDVDSSEFIQTLGHALKNTVINNQDQLMEKIMKFHSITENLTMKICDRSAAVEEISFRIANNLKMDHSVISNILLNLNEIWLSNFAETNNLDNEYLKTLLNLASKCGYDYKDYEFLQVMGDALEKILQVDLEHKSQKADTLHMLTLHIASQARDKSLLLTSVACKIVDKLNLDMSHAINISHILSNVQEICQCGIIPSSIEVKDKNLEMLLKQATGSDVKENEEEYLSQLGIILEKLINADPKHKLDIINTLQSLSSNMVVEVRKQPPNKIQLLRSLIKNNLELKDDIVEKLSSILDENEMAMCVAFRNMSWENPDFVGKVLCNAAAILNDKRIDEKKAVETLHRAIVKAVGETSEQKVAQALHRKEGVDFQSLIVDASSLAKALGMSEVVHVLDDILKDSRSMPMLAKDKIVMEVLKRLTVMRQLAEKQPTLRAALHDLQYDPYAARNDPRLRALVRDSAVLMVIPEESLVLRSSADIPSSLLFCNNTLAVEDFMVKSRQTGKTFLILKKGIQMVVPREAARDVLTGKVPYTVLDENGIHHFTPLHVFNALKLPRIATNRFSNYGYSPKVAIKSKSKGQECEEMMFSRCNSLCVDDAQNNFSNGSCSTQEAIASRSSTPMKRVYGDGGGILRI